jgi:pSer/pThr/pTyr-binding forkhead associated (FHA) protein
VATLIVTSGPISGRRVNVGGAVTVGRESADLTIADERVSRRHAVFRPLEGGVAVEDLGSLNGTWVNGIRIEAPVRLGAGDTVVVGGSSIEVEQAAPPELSPVGRLGEFTPVATPRRRTIASRRLTPTVLSFGIVVATAIVLLVYFAAR